MGSEPPRCGAGDAGRPTSRAHSSRPAHGCRSSAGGSPASQQLHRQPVGLGARADGCFPLTVRLERDPDSSRSRSFPRVTEGCPGIPQSTPSPVAGAPAGDPAPSKAHLTQTREFVPLFTWRCLKRRDPRSLETPHFGPVTPSGRGSFGFTLSPEHKITQKDYPISRGTVRHRGITLP